MEKIKDKIKKFLCKHIEAIFLCIKLLSNRKVYKVYLIGTEDYGNLGDHKIALTEKEILEKLVMPSKFIEIPSSIYFKCASVIKFCMRNNNIIFLTGGGNFGNQYMYAQKIRRDVVKKYKKNKIVLFPVTIYYTKDKIGKENYSKDKLLFGSHKSLIFSVRDKYSANFLKINFPNLSYFLVPDIVLLSKYNKEFNRNGVLLCLRNDLEKKLSSKDITKIKKIVAKYKMPIKKFDTQLNKNIKIINRAKVLDNVLNMFAHKEIVITDRLHGVIFAVITNTPCIAFDNYNHKLRGIAEWLNKNNKFIYLQDVSYLEKSIKFLNNNKKNENFNYEYYDNKFYLLINEIVDLLKEEIKC